jgi:hypothetical protein
MYKVERKVSGGTFYEVMLSPFKTHDEASNYYKKYSQYYSPESRIYKFTNLETRESRVIKY